MSTPNLDGDPNADPYDVLGVDPTSGPDEFLPKQQIEAKAKELIQNNKDDKDRYRTLQIALKNVREIHPDRSSDGTWRVPLQIDVAEDPVEVQTPFTITVTTPFGDLVSGAKIQSTDGKRLGRTENDGTAEIKISGEIGEVEIVADKPAEDNKEFPTANTTVTVEKRQVRLVFDDAPNRCSAGDEIKVRIAGADGDPKAAVEVTPESGSSAETNEDGWARVQVDAVGRTMLSAEKSDNEFFHYETAQTRITVEKRDVSLRIAESPDSSTVGERERFRVVEDGTDDPLEDVEVTVAGASATTNPSGWATLELSPKAVGKTDIVASKQDTTGITYTDDTETVEVEERTVELSFASPPSEVTVVGETRFRVVDQNGDPVSDVTVAGGTARDSTSNAGYAMLSFGPSDLGRVRIVGKKGGVEGIEYVRSETTVAIKKKSVDLQLAQQTSSPKVDRDVEFQVRTSDGAPVEGATVKHRQLSDTSDSNGSASLQFGTAGTKRVVVRKRETPKRTFESGSAEVEIQRRVKRLEINPPDGDIVVYDTVTFTVRTQSGDTVSDAGVNPEDADPGTTDSHGQLDVTFTSPGTKTVKVSKTRTEKLQFEDGKEEVTVKKQQSKLRFAEAPRNCTTGDEIDVRVVGANGSPEEDVEVSPKAGSAARTDDEGRAHPRIEAVGKTKVTARKPDTDLVHYIPAETAITVEKRDVSLRIAESPDSSTVGERERFRVVEDGTDDPLKDVEVTVAGASATTTKSGRTVLELPPKAVGTTEVVASKADSRRVRYSDATETIEVEKRTVELSFASPPSEATVGEDTQFRVVDQNSDPVTGVTVAGGTARDRTNTTGHATLSFEPSDLGRLSITADKQGPKGIEYLDVESALSVKKRQVQLQLSLRTAPPKVDDEIHVQVKTEDNAPVEGATVKHRSQSDTTDRKGLASLQIGSVGEKTIIAHKPETARTVFESDTLEVEIQRHTRRLSIEPPDGKVEAYNPVTFTVKTQTGDPVADATVDADDAEVATTDRHGEATIRFTGTGSKQVNVSKAKTEKYRFINDTERINVATPPKSVSIVDVSDDVSVGDELRVKVVDYKGDPLEDALIKLMSETENHVQQTNKNGEACFRVGSSGFYQVSATKEDFEVYDEDRVRVKQ